MKRIQPRPTGVLVPAAKLTRLVKKWRKLSVTDCDMTFRERRSCAEDLERLLKRK